MKSLEEYFRQQSDQNSLFLERRENQYRTQKVERTRIVKPSTLLKAMAAMYLFQPHRSARDFRAIRKEFQDKIMQAEHSVVPYYSCCFADYRFEFIVRNDRLDKNKKIFKYYILYAIGYIYSKSINIFDKSQENQKSIGDSILDLVSDDDKYIAFCEKQAVVLVKLVEDRIGGAFDDIDREKLRDTIRSDGFLKAFRNHLDNDSKPTKVKRQK